MFEILHVKEGGHVHFIGIGGISMSSLAKILLHRHFVVSGSDMQRTHITDELASLGAKIDIGHAPEHVDGADLVVYTAAISKTNPEYIAAMQRCPMVVERSVFLGELMKSYRFPCCIAGTHGKTTTTTMAAMIMMQTAQDPTVLVGGEVTELGGAVKIGGRDVFLAEACEYVESFLDFFPQKAVILNVEEDHLDYYENIDHIISSFHKFACIVPADGVIIVNGADKNAQKAVENVRGTVLTFGIGDGFDYMAKNVVFDKHGYASYDLSAKDGLLTHVVLSVPGKHNIYNSLAAAALCHQQGASGDAIAEGLLLCKGAHRRFEIKGEADGVLVVDDYAHHPTEIKAALDTAKRYGDQKITAVFQSHTYTRTKALLKEFSEAFDNADRIIVTDIYAAREKDTGLVHPNDLVQLLKARGKDALYISDFSDIAAHLKRTAQPGEMVITIGAGTVYQVGELFLK